MQLVKINTDGQKLSVREYKNSTATTDRRLTFREFKDWAQLDGVRAQQEFSRYCQSRNAEAVAYVEKARAAGLTLSYSTETLGKDNAVNGIRLAFTKAKVPAIKAPKVKFDDLKAALAKLTAEERAELLKA